MKNTGTVSELIEGWTERLSEGLSNLSTEVHQGGFEMSEMDLEKVSGTMEELQMVVDTIILLKKVQPCVDECPQCGYDINRWLRNNR